MNILMIGPDREKLKGGMSSVINSYFNSELIKKLNIIPIGTVVDGSRIIKLKVFVISYIKTLYILLFKNIDIVHVHVASRTSFKRKSFYINLVKKFNKKIVIHMHGGQFDKFYWDESNDKQRRKITKVLDKADIIIALGEKWRERIVKYCSTEVITIPNSLNSQKSNLYNENSNNILFLGRLEEAKGIYDLIDTVDRLNKLENVKFILAGDGDKDRLESLLIKRNLQDKIIMTGWLDKNEVEDRLKDTMIFLLPSYDEGMPMSILEAMSFGIPIISTKVGSIPEVISDNNGILIEPGNIDELANAIRYLVENKDKRIKMSTNNYKKIKENFDIEVNNSKLISLYEGLMKD
ncbi:glycosyltransferase family 1 protein [Clostridium perfringens]|uniref:glycosyltransferase family 4 protein n=1 Tax=Clostridium perfringens TaxID=1502 RepID=UPI000D92B293|nr:glycosyltransferase family 4 protein [Clostridium perfringens]UBK58662.1 glycosyltransferase family 4 protein [Clostridium perfringens]UBK61194.1 glycosyltransferase family 4 protein [Clostridium perfringens]SQB23574.1 glycosytransferase [Clostridium perfringens]VTQ58485.1 glycosytransferase [Clostridium perfringens]HAT4281564.1 glycosyltransferase family 4 protein [Clostridium perfringens]